MERKIVGQERGRKDERGRERMERDRELGEGRLDGARYGKGDQGT